MQWLNSYFTCPVSRVAQENIFWQLLWAKVFICNYQLLLSQRNIDYLIFTHKTESTTGFIFNPRELQTVIYPELLYYTSLVARLGGLEDCITLPPEI